MRLACFAWLPLAFAVQVPAQLVPTAPFHGVHVSDPYEDGSVWVRGGRYKLGLGSEVTFQPLFGPSAARDWPLRLQFRGVQEGGAGAPDAALPTAWSVEGHRAERRRGTAVERWDFAPDEVQQSFVLQRPEAAGDLVCRLDVATDLRAEPAGPGVAFVAPDGLGSVHYSDAVVVDAAGSRLEVPVEWQDGFLSITVPAAFVAEAQWPVVVDPWLHTVVVDGSVSDVQDARVAYDETNDVWLVVAEEVLSATDSDIVSWRFANGPGAPTLLDTVYVQGTSNQTVNPDVANMAEHRLFVVAWYDTTNFGPGSGELRYRRRSAGSTSSSGALTASSGFGIDPSNRALVGGALTGRLFVVAATTRSTSGSTPVQMRLLDIGGVAFDTHQFTLPTALVAPPADISARRDASDPWVLVWEECLAGCSGTQIVAMGVLAPQNAGSFTVQAPVPLASGNADLSPRIAGWGGRWLVVWQRQTFRGAASLLGQPLHAPGGSVAALGTIVDLHAGEPNSVPALRRTSPAVSFDGVRHVVTYDEHGPSGTEPFAMTVLVDSAGGVAWHDGHVALGIGSGTGHGALDSAASTGSHLGQHFVVLQRPTTNGDVLGAEVDAYAAGTLTTVADIGCGQPSEPTIGIVGTPALGRSFTVTLGNVVGAPFLLIGQPAVSALPGCGSCQQGVGLLSAVTVFGGSTSITVPGSGAFLNLPIGFQGITMLQAGGCPAGVFGIEFAVSDALSVQIL